MTKNNKGSLFVFEVGPSVKFISAITDAIFNKKIGVIFFRKKTRLFTGFSLSVTFPNWLYSTLQGAKNCDWNFWMEYCKQIIPFFLAHTC